MSKRKKGADLLNFQSSMNQGQKSPNNIVERTAGKPQITNLQGLDEPSLLKILSLLLPLTMGVIHKG